MGDAFVNIEKNYLHEVIILLLNTLVGQSYVDIF